MILKKLLKFDGDIYIFGTGAMGLNVLKELKKKKINIKGFIDNDILKHGKTLQGLRIIKPEIINKESYIVIASSWYLEIETQLQKIGLKKFDNYLYWEDFFGIYGDFDNWQEAESLSRGYNSEIILNKVKNSLLKVKQGEALYERDSVLFDKPDYSFPLIASLLFIANSNGGDLNVLDFGGSLGSTYYECKKFFDFKKINWNVVEQEEFVRVGKEHFEDDTLKFYNNIQKCLQTKNIDVIIFSSVLQYLEVPYLILEEVIGVKVPFILFDKMPFNNKKEDRLSIQYVPPNIYDADYPVWIMSKEKLINFFYGKYNIFLEFESHIKIKIDGEWKSYEGFLMKRG